MFAPEQLCSLRLHAADSTKQVGLYICVFETTVQRLNQTASNMLHNSLIIRLGKFGPLDYSQMSPLQIRILSNGMSFVTALNLTHQ